MSAGADHAKVHPAHHEKHKIDPAMIPNRRQQLLDLFALIDSDHSGTIEFKELCAMVKLVKSDAKDADVAKQFRELDQSKDGKVQKEEFVKAYLEHFKADTDVHFYERMQHTSKFLRRKPKLASVFVHFDEDKSGFLDRGELYRMVRLSKPRFTNDDLTELFKKIDTNHDNKISKDEFVLYYFNLFFAADDDEFDVRVEEAMQGRRKVKLQILYNTLDEDGNGSLDLNEFGRMLRVFSKESNVVKAEDVLDTLVKIDADHNRKVDYSEWLTYMNALFATMDDRQFYRTIGRFQRAVQAERAARRGAPAPTAHQPHLPTAGAKTNA
jgi:Ca2+-binding EF-hand superfamily protein